MSSGPNLASGINSSGGTLPATADTSTTAPTNTTTVFTAGSAGSRVEQIRACQILTSGSAGIINVFLHDGSTYYLFDQYAYAVGTVSASALVAPVDFYYANLFLPSGWTIRVTNTVASGTGATGATHKVTVFGGNF